MIDPESLAGAIVIKKLEKVADEYAKRFKRKLRVEMIDADGLTVHNVGSLDFSDPEVNLGDVAVEAFADYFGDIDEECWPVFVEKFEEKALSVLQEQR